MPDLRFEWDVRKETRNRQKHGVSFGEAETVFSDEHALLIDDPEHSADENRFLLTGPQCETSRPHLPRRRGSHSDHFRTQGDPQGTGNL